MLGLMQFLIRIDNQPISKGTLTTLKQALSFMEISAIICVCEVVFFYLYQYAAIASKTMQFIGVCIETLINTALFIIWGLFTEKTSPDSADKPKSSISFYDFILLLLIIGIPLIWNSIT